MLETLLIFSCLASVGLWFWAMLDMSQRHFKESANRDVWIMAVLFFPLIGSIFYLQMRRQLTTTEGRKFQPKFNRR